jgi:hypothetical protein
MSFNPAYPASFHSGGRSLRPLLHAYCQLPSRSGGVLDAGLLFFGTHTTYCQLPSRSRCARPGRQRFPSRFTSFRRDVASLHFTFYFLLFTSYKTTSISFALKRKLPSKPKPLAQPYITAIGNIRKKPIDNQQKPTLKLKNLSDKSRKMILWHSRNCRSFAADQINRPI